MKILKSLWFVCIMALFLNLAIVYFLVQQTISNIKSAKIQLLTPKKEEKDSFFWSYRTNEIEQLAESIFNEKNRINKKQEEIRSIEERIKAEKVELVRLKRDIEKMRDALSKDLIIITEEESKNIRYIVNTYSKLSVEALIPILQQMDDKTLIKILSSMKADTVSAVFEQMLLNDDANQTNAKKIAIITEMMRKKANLNK